MGLEQWDLDQCVCHKLLLTGLIWLCMWPILTHHGLCLLSPLTGQGDESIYVQSLGFPNSIPISPVLSVTLQSALLKQNLLAKYIVLLLTVLKVLFS